MKSKIKERRVIYQDWYETDFSKTGWDTNIGWYFKEGDLYSPEWRIKKHLDYDKHGNPILAVAERKIKV